MYSTVTSKLTLYDIFSMLIPGGIISWILLKYLEGYTLLNLSLINDLPEWSRVVAFFILSYMIGIINLIITEMIWKRFRNNPEEILAWYTAVFKDQERTPKRQIKRYYVFLIPYFYVSISFVLYFLYITPKGDINVYILLLGLISILTVFLQVYGLAIKYGSDRIVSKYYEMYYYVESHRPQNPADIIEKQVSFLKSICLPISVLVPAYIHSSDYFKNCPICFFLLLFVIFYLIVIIACIRQSVVYRIIIEDYKYLSEKEKNRNKPKLEI